MPVRAVLVVRVAVLRAAVAVALVSRRPNSGAEARTEPGTEPGPPRNPGPKPAAESGTESGPEPGAEVRGRSRARGIRCPSSQPSSRAIASSEAIVVAKSSGETAPATRERMPSTIVAEPLLGGATLVGEHPGAVALLLDPAALLEAAQALALAGEALGEGRQLDVAGERVQQHPVATGDAGARRRRRRTRG